MTTHEISAISGEQLFHAVSIALGLTQEQWEQSAPHKVPLECALDHKGISAVRSFAIGKLGPTVEFPEQQN